MAAKYSLVMKMESPILPKKKSWKIKLKEKETNMVSDREPSTRIIVFA